MAELPTGPPPPIPPRPSEQPATQAGSKPPDIDPRAVAKYYGGVVLHVWNSTRMTIRADERVLDQLYLHTLNRNVNREHMAKLKDSLYTTLGHEEADPLEITVGLLLDDFYAFQANPSDGCQLAVLDGQHRVTAAREMIKLSLKSPGARQIKFVVCLTLLVCADESVLIQRIERINFSRPYDPLDKEHVNVRNAFLEALYQCIGTDNRRRRAIQELTRSPMLRDETWTRRLRTYRTSWFIEKLKELAKEPEYERMTKGLNTNSARGLLVFSSGLKQLADETNLWVSKLAEYPVTPVESMRRNNKKARKLEDVDS